LATLGFGVVSVVYPFGRDQGLFAFQADVMLHGLRLYRDMPMMQLPMTAVVHLVALLLFGRSMTAVRILDLFWTAGIAVLLYSCVRSMFRRYGLALVAGLLYPFLYYAFDWWHTAEVDGFLNLPVVGAFALAAAAVNRRSGATVRVDRARWFFAGLLVAVAVLFKYTAALVLPVLLVWPLLVGRREWTKVRGSLLWLVIGFAAGLAGFLVTAAAVGALPEMLRMQSRVTLPYAGLARYQLSLPARIITLFRLFARGSGGDFLPGVVLASLGLLPALAALLAPEPDSNRGVKAAVVVTLAWLAVGLASVFVQNKFFHYHYLVAIPALAVLGSFALASVAGTLWHRLARGWQRAVLVALGIAAALVVSPYPDRYPVVTRVIRGAESMERSWRSTGYRSGDFVVAEQLALADYLAENTRPEERVLNLGIDPWIMFPAWRQPVFRYTSPPNAPTCTLTTAFRADPPAVLVVKHGDRLPWVLGTEQDSYERLMTFDQFRDFILANYQLEVRIGKFDVLRLVGRTRWQLDDIAPGSPLAIDIEDARRVVEGLDPKDYRCLLWPLDEAPSVTGLSPERIVTYRELNAALWSNQGSSPSDLLPAISVWVRGDDRPLARLEPFCFQDDGENYITDHYRFRLLHICGNGLVLVYIIEERTGEEVLAD